MNVSLKKITELLPDYEDLQKLADDIKKLSFEKARLEHSIKERESTIFLTCSRDEKYFQGGKPPSVSFVQSAYIYTGLNGELLPNRSELINVETLLDRTKMQYALYKDLLDIWRTLNANERQTAL